MDRKIIAIISLLLILLIESFLFLPKLYWTNNEVSIFGLFIEIVSIIAQIILALIIVNTVQKRSDDHRAIKAKLHSIVEDINEKHKKTIGYFNVGGKNGTYYVSSFKIIQGRIAQLNSFCVSEISVDLSALQQQYTKFQIAITNHAEFNENFNNTVKCSLEFQNLLEELYGELEKEFITASLLILKS